MDRISYLIRRILLCIPTFIGITVVCFALTRFLPGGPVETQLMKMRGMGASSSGPGERSAAVTESHKKELIKQFGFDKPLYEQYKIWLVDNCMGIKLKSYMQPDKTAGELILSRMPVSIGFGLAAFICTYLVCIPLGISKALRHGQFFDSASSVLVFTGYAIPAFALAMVFKMLFCGTVEGLWDIFPIGGFCSEEASAAGGWTAFKDIVWHMFLPVVCYVSGAFAMLTLLMKNSLLDQIAADYVRTVIAKGATRRRAVWCHALRNALIPIATGFGEILAFVFAGSIIIETVFEIPGMGRLSWDAVNGRDYAVFMALLALTSSITLIGNLVSDFAYMLIDPRVDFSAK